MSCPFMSCHVLSYRITSRHVISCHALSRHVMSWGEQAKWASGWLNWFTDQLTDIVTEEEEIAVRPPPLEDVEEVEVLSVYVSDHHHLHVHVQFMFTLDYMYKYGYFSWGWVRCDSMVCDVIWCDVTGDVIDQATNRFRYQDMTSEIRSSRLC